MELLSVVKGRPVAARANSKAIVGGGDEQAESLCPRALQLLTQLPHLQHQIPEKHSSVDNTLNSSTCTSLMQHLLAPLQSRQSWHAFIANNIQMKRNHGE